MINDLSQMSLLSQMSHYPFVNVKKNLCIRIFL